MVWVRDFGKRLKQGIEARDRNESTDASRSGNTAEEHIGAGGRCTASSLCLQFSELCSELLL